jgi:hypothetical protein
MAGQSFAEFVRKWERLNNGLKPMLPELPHLVQQQADFESLITEAKGLDDQQKMLRGKLQDTTQQRRAAYLKALDLHERLAVQLKGQLGLRNQNLVGFGLRARKVPKRLQKPAPHPPGPAPHPAPEAKGAELPTPHEAQEVTSAPVPK